MRLIIIDHAAQRMRERGASEDEVSTVLEQGDVVPASGGRRAKELVFRYNAEWMGRLYGDKKVRVVYEEAGETVAVITVYAFYGRWEEG